MNDQPDAEIIRQHHEEIVAAARAGERALIVTPDGRCLVSTEAKVMEMLAYLKASAVDVERTRKNFARPGMVLVVVYSATRLSTSNLELTDSPMGAVRSRGGSA